MDFAIEYDPRLDLVVHALCRVERRLTLEYLSERDEPVEVEELTDAIVERTDGDHRDAERARAQVSEALRYRHLPLLATTGIVEVDDGTVRLEQDGAADAVDRIRSVARELLDVDDEPTLGVPSVTRAMHDRDDDDRLSDTVAATIRAHRGTSFDRGDFALFDDLDAEAVDELFQVDSAPHTRVAFTTEAVHVELWCDDGVEIRVTDSVAG